MSAASHLPTAIPPQISRQNTGNRGASAASNAKRARGQAANPQADDSRQEFNHPPSSSHPSLPTPYANGFTKESSATRNGLSEWTPGQLEGPGMPLARPYVPTPPAAAEVDTDGGAAGVDGEADGDDGKTYCFCERGSFGEMIACDDSNCEREWVRCATSCVTEHVVLTIMQFHLACINLTVAPEGSWICDACLARRANKRSGRGGKRRAGGGRAGARNTST